MAETSAAMTKIVSGRNLLLLGGAFGLDRCQHLFRGGWQRSYPHAYRVMYGIQYCGRGGDRGRFADAFGAERSGWIEALHDVDRDLRHVERSRHDIIRQVGIDMAPIGVEQHFLMQGHANAHRNAALDLALDQHGICLLYTSPS